MFREVDLFKLRPYGSFLKFAFCQSIQMGRGDWGRASLFLYWRKFLQAHFSILILISSLKLFFDCRPFVLWAWIGEFFKRNRAIPIFVKILKSFLHGRWLWWGDFVWR